MPLKERSGKLLREFININYKVINSQKLKEMGYEKVDLIDTTNDKWIMKSEAHWMGLSGSALLTGTK